MYNLTFDNPYNRNIQKRLLELTKNQGWEPTRLDRNVGGGMEKCGGSRLRPSAEQQKSFFRVVPNSHEFVQPGVGASYPQLNMDELREYNKLSLNNDEVIPYQGGKFNFKKDILKPVGTVARSKPVKNLLKTGLKSAVKASVLAVTKNPVLAETIGEATSGITNDLVDKGTEQIGKGKGMKKPRKPRVKKMAGVEEYKGGKLELLLSKSEDVKDVKEPKKSKKVNMDKKMKRATLVKKIMKEKNMSLPQASKYIKENNLM